MSSDKPSRRSLPITAWPPADRAAWEAALEGNLTETGAPARVADWKCRTVRNAVSSIGQFAAWARETGRLTDQPSIHHAVTPEALKAFIRDEQQRIRLGGISNHLFHLLGGLEVFAPGQNWGWAWRVLWRVKARAKKDAPGSRSIVHSSRLYDLGHTQMGEAMKADQTVDLAGFRNGLAVAMLIMAPMRSDDFSTLRLGREIKPDGRGWTIHLASGQTKTAREDGWRIDGELAERLAFYVDVVRPHLLARLREPVRTDRLWVGVSGRPVGQQTVRKWIKIATEAGLGTCISPHSFRHSAATTFVLEKPEKAMEAGALLGHTSSATTERHYIMQQRQLAQGQYLDLLRQRMRAGGHE